jgi:hypothetical protein
MYKTTTAITATHTADLDATHQLRAQLYIKLLGQLYINCGALLLGSSTAAWALQRRHVPETTHTASLWLLVFN